MINATENACRVLVALRRLGGAGVTELSEELDYSPSAVHAQLNTLRQQGFVVQEGTTYRLSLRFLDMSRHVVSRFGDVDVVRSEVDSLADETGEVAQFGTDERGELVYVLKSRGDNAVKTGSFTGKREHLHSTAMGKAILSTMSDDGVEEVIDAFGLPEQTPRTATDPAELLDTVDDVRDRGYAVDDEENVRGLRSVAVPVTANDDRIGAVSVTGPASRMGIDEMEGELSTLLERSANIIEVNYKFS